GALLLGGRGRLGRLLLLRRLRLLVLLLLLGHRLVALLLRLGRRGRLRVAAGVGLGLAALGSAAGTVPGGLALTGDHRQLAADLGGLVLVNHDAGQYARGGRGDLGVDLVRGDLEQRLVGLDPVTFLLQPTG